MWRKIFFWIFCLAMVYAIIGTWIIPRTPEHDKIYPPDWAIRITALLMIPVAYMVLVRMPREISVAGAYARKQKSGLAVGFYTCPRCHERFCREGACPRCPGFPDLVFQEEVWKV